MFHNPTLIYFLRFWLGSDDVDSNPSFDDWLDWDFFGFVLCRSLSTCASSCTFELLSVFNNSLEYDKNQGL